MVLFFKQISGQQPMSDLKKHSLLGVTIPIMLYISSDQSSIRTERPVWLCKHRLFALWHINKIFLFLIICPYNFGFLHLRLLNWMKAQASVKNPQEHFIFSITWEPENHESVSALCCLSHCQFMAQDLRLMADNRNEVKQSTALLEVKLTHWPQGDFNDIFDE